jgi:MFS family permease
VTSVTERPAALSDGVPPRGGAAGGVGTGGPPSGGPSSGQPSGGRRAPRISRDHPRYKWVALSNTTLGVLLMTLNSSIVLISLPAIFKGIGLDPLQPGNTSYLLWLLVGYLLASAVLVVSFGRLGDMYGRVRIYNIGFAIFAVASVILALDPLKGGHGALWLIGFRVVQSVGGSMLFANSTAILTDAFPARQRGMALGINGVAAISGSFIGLLAGGLLSEWNWRAIFWASVPVALIGAIWSYTSLHEVGGSGRGKLDIPGNATFAVGMTVLLAGITYGIQPYGGHTEGWLNPWVLAGLIGGVILLAAFWQIEKRVAEPMFDPALFHNRPFALGNFANLVGSIGRGGMQFLLIIWLQGIWLPLHGYAYSDTPLWAGIYLLPLTIGFLIAGPLSGVLSDRFGPRLFATTGQLIVAATFIALILLPVDFPYWLFALVLAVNGIGSGLFSSPNTAQIMNSVRPEERGAASGMRGTFFNAGSSLSIGLFFSLLIVGLAGSLPGALTSGLHAQGVPLATAQSIGTLPPVASLFAAFLGINPIQTLLTQAHALSGLSAQAQATLTGRSFFPHLIAAPFHNGLEVVMIIAASLTVLGAAGSWISGRTVRGAHRGPRHGHPAPPATHAAGRSPEPERVAV